MSTDGQDTKRRRNIAENFNRLSRVHECYRHTTDRQRNGRQHIANSLKTNWNFCSASVVHVVKLLKCVIFCVASSGVLCFYVSSDYVMCYLVNFMHECDYNYVTYPYMNSKIPVLYYYHESI